MDTIYSIPPLHIMGSLIYDLLLSYLSHRLRWWSNRPSSLSSHATSSSTSTTSTLSREGRWQTIFFDGNLILYPLVNEVRSLGIENITDLMVCFFLFPFRHWHWHESLTGDFPIVQGFVDYPRIYICMIVNRALCPAHHKLYCQEYQFRSGHLFRALILREQITCLTL